MKNSKLDDFFQKYFNILKEQDFATEDESPADFSTGEKYAQLYAFYGIKLCKDARGAEVVANRSCTPDSTNSGIAGAFDNDDDDTLELVIPVEKIKSSNDIKNLFERYESCAYAIVENVRKGKDGAGTEIEGIVDLSEIVKGDDFPSVKLTFVVCSDENDESKKNEFERFSKNYKFKKNKIFSTEIIFPKDLLIICEIECAPDFVENAVVSVEPENVLRFSTNTESAVVVNLRASSLNRLFKEYRKRGLFEQNLRYYVKKKDVDTPIEETAKNAPKSFWYLNNGITIICDKFEFTSPDKSEIELTNFSIINGCQTTNVLGRKFTQDELAKNDFSVLCKIVSVGDLNEDDKTEFIANIAEAANRQKPIKDRDLIANKPEQRKLKKMLAENDIFYALKRGGEKPQKEYESWQCATSDEIGKLLLSALGQHPGPARTRTDSVFKTYYTNIFKKEHKPIVYHDLLLLNSFVEEWSKHELDREDIGEKTDRIALIKNGKLGILATFVAFAKFATHPELKKPAYAEGDKIRDALSCWDDMENGFFGDRDTKTKEGRDTLRHDCFLVFNRLMDGWDDIPGCISLAYKDAKISDASLIPSNFFKSDKYHEIVLRLLNQIFDNLDSVGITEIFKKPISNETLCDRRENALFALRKKMKTAKKTKNKTRELWLKNDTIKKIAERGDDILNKKNPLLLSELGLSADQCDHWEKQIKKALKNA